MTPSTQQRLRYAWYRTGPVAGLCTLLALVGFALSGLVDGGQPQWVMPVWSTVMALLPVGQAFRAYSSEQGFIGHIDGARYVFFGPLEDNDPTTTDIAVTHAQWADYHRQRHGNAPYDVLGETTVHVGENPPVVAGVPAATAFGSTKVIEIDEAHLATDAHWHELDHVLAWHLYSDRDDWNNLSHDERLALLEAA